MTDITEMLGLDKLDRMSWEFSMQISAPRLCLSYLVEDGYPLLRVDCHGQLGFEYIRDIRFDGQTKTGVHVSETVHYLVADSERPAQRRFLSSNTMPVLL